MKYDLERNVNLIKFSEGKIDIGFNENLIEKFCKKFKSEKLLGTWTWKKMGYNFNRKKWVKKHFLNFNQYKKKEN